MVLDDAIDSTTFVSSFSPVNNALSTTVIGASEVGLIVEVVTSLESTEEDVLDFVVVDSDGSSPD